MGGIRKPADYEALPRGRAEQGWLFFQLPRLGEFGLALARYNPTGALDPSFGIGGIVTTYTTLDAQASVGAMALAFDGTIVLGGGGYNGHGIGVFIVAEYV